MYKKIECVKYFYSKYKRMLESDLYGIMYTFITIIKFFWGITQFGQTLRS